MTALGGPRGPVVFFGTAPFAVPALEALAASGEVVSRVVTQPDRPKGRGRKTAPSAVKTAAEALGLPVAQPPSVNDPAFVAGLSVQDPEFLVVVAYGQILGDAVLASPRRSAVNVHPSLLPRHRGATPVAGAILAGDREIGVSTMEVGPGVDDGPVFLQLKMPLDPSATRGELDVRLADLGADLVIETLAGLRAGTVRGLPQQERFATFTGRITAARRRLGWSGPADEVRRRAHALSPAPGALACLDGKLVKILRVALVEGSGAPGRVVATDPRGPVVACGVGAVVLVEVQPEGKRSMAGAAWVRGGGAPLGARFEPEGEGARGEG